jgi:hypothetical protein
MPGESVGARGASPGDKGLWVVSGIDPNPEARDVFVWHHDKATDQYSLLGSGRIVGGPGSVIPPQVVRGQYRVTVATKGGVSSDDIHVTDDKSGKNFLEDVTITRQPDLNNVSGIDPNPEARDVFVWHHDRATDRYSLLGSGRIVGGPGSVVPPQVVRGQYRVTVATGGAVSSDDIYVTDDRSGKNFLSNVTITRQSNLNM